MENGGNYRRNNKQFNNSYSGNHRYNNNRNGFSNDGRDDIYSPKVYPKKRKVSSQEAFVDSMNIPDYIMMKNEINEKRRRDLEYKKKRSN